MSTKKGASTRASGVGVKLEVKKVMRVVKG